MHVSALQGNEGAKDKNYQEDTGSKDLCQSMAKTYKVQCEQLLSYSKRSLGIMIASQNTAELWVNPL